MNLAVDIEEAQNHYIVRVSCEVDVYTAPDLKDQLFPHTEVHGNDIQVDLKDITYMDSTGLGVFISAYKSAKEHESSMELIHAKDRVSRLFKVTGLDEIINVRFDDNNKEGQ